MELFRQLKILYMQLPYILYKKKYLIPNAPNWDNCCMKYHFDKLENL